MTNRPTELEQELQRLFERFDVDQNGRVDEREFRKILEALGESPSDEVLSLEFALIDKNSDGLVDYREFAEWWLDYK